jgi:hypothetical protein
MTSQDLPRDPGDLHFALIQLMARERVTSLRREAYDLTALGPAGERWPEDFDAGYQNEIAAWEERNTRERTRRPARRTWFPPAAGQASLFPASFAQQ